MAAFSPRRRQSRGWDGPTAKLTVGEVVGDEVTTSVLRTRRRTD
jgi:hypothetical protein